MPTPKWKGRKLSLAASKPLPRPEAARATIEEANKATGFLSLPAEIRNLIYNFALPVKQDLRSSIVWDQKRIFAQCRVFHASRQLRRESLSLFAGSNLFEIRLHFGALHTLSLMNVLCLDPTAMRALRTIEVVASYACSHASTMMPFFGCTSVFVDREESTVVPAGAGTWTTTMECDRKLKYGEVGAKCQRVRQENLELLLEEVRAAGLQDRGVAMGKAELEALARKLARKGKKKKESGFVPMMGRALKREASLVGSAMERYRETATFLG